MCTSSCLTQTKTDTTFDYFQVDIDSLSYEELYERFGGPAGQPGLSKRAIANLPLRCAGAKDCCHDQHCTVCLQVWTSPRARSNTLNATVRCGSPARRGRDSLPKLPKCVLIIFIDCPPSSITVDGSICVAGSILWDNSLGNTTSDSMTLRYCSRMIKGSSSARFQSACIPTTRRASIPGWPFMPSALSAEQLSSHHRRHPEASNLIFKYAIVAQCGTLS